MEEQSRFNSEIVWVFIVFVVIAIVLLMIIYVLLLVYINSV